MNTLSVTSTDTAALYYLKSSLTPAENTRNHGWLSCLKKFIEEIKKKKRKILKDKRGIKKNIEHRRSLSGQRRKVLVRTEKSISP